jgi:protein gp37
MNPTAIEWVKNQDGITQGYTLNPVKGLCPMQCSYCYAAKIYKRFKWDTTLRFDYDGLGMSKSLSDPIFYTKDNLKFFVGSTMELFGDWIDPQWMKDIFDHVKNYPNHTFIFLTKKPENLIKYSLFPSNVWVGASATNRKMWFDAIWELQNIKAPVKFISFEPLLDWTYSDKEPDDHVSYMADWLKRAGISWIIIGQMTPISVKTQPQIDWIKGIVEACDKVGAKVFLKNNLKTLLVRDDGFANVSTELLNRNLEKGTWELRQEMPIIKSEVK